MSQSGDGGYEWTYYDHSIPDIIQVSEHKFIERKVIDLWINLMMVSWTSATNCARLYNMSIAKDAGPVPDGWPTFALSSDHVWDGFIILSLLEDHQTQGTVLCVPHGGERRDRYTAAVQARNTRIRLYGQEELRHICDKCSRYFTHADGSSE